MKEINTFIIKSFSNLHILSKLDKNIFKNNERNRSKTKSR